MRCNVTLTLVLLILASVLPATAEPQANTVPAPTRAFTFSDDPGAVVLHVSVRPAQRPGTKSMVMYGDGRVALRKMARPGGRILASYDLQVDRAEVESLWRIATTHDLVDWNPAAIQIRQERTGRPFTAASADAPSTDITIALESYGERQDAGRAIRGLRDLRVARMLYPDFPEYKGIEALVRYMNDAFEQTENAP